MEAPIETWRRLPRDVRVLFAARFVNRAGAFALPFLTLYLTQTLATSIQTAGLVVAAFGLASMVSRLLGGRLADTWGRRPTILVGLIGCTGSLVVLASATNLAMAAGAVVLLGLSFEIYESPTQALVADLVEPIDRPAAFGALGAALSVSAVVAGLIASVVAPLSLRLLLVADAATCLAAVVVVLRWLPKASGSTPASAAGREGRGPWRDPLFVFLFVTNTLFAACYLQVFVSLPLTLRSHGIGPGWLGLLYTVSAVVVIVGQPLLRAAGGPLRTPRFAVSVGFALMAVGFLGYGVATTWPGFVLATVVFSLGEILLMGHLVALVSTIATASRRGGFLAAYGLSWGLAATVGPPVGTWLLTTGGDQLLWLTTALCSAVVAVAHLAKPRVGSRA